MFKVFATHAASSAVLAFNTGPVHGEAIGDYRGEPLYHASLNASEYSELLDQFGFEILRLVVEDPEAAAKRFGSLDPGAADWERLMKKGLRLR
jgi:hypothetical protein